MPPEGRSGSDYPIFILSLTSPTHGCFNSPHHDDDDRAGGPSTSATRRGVIADRAADALAATGIDKNLAKRPRQCCPGRCPPIHLRKLNGFGQILAKSRSARRPPRRCRRPLRPVLRLIGSAEIRARSIVRAPRLSKRLSNPCLLRAAWQAQASPFSASRRPSPLSSSAVRQSRPHPAERCGRPWSGQ